MGVLLYGGSYCLIRGVCGYDNQGVHACIEGVRALGAVRNTCILELDTSLVLHKQDKIGVRT